MKAVHMLGEDLGEATARIIELRNQLAAAEKRADAAERAADLARRGQDGYRSVAERATYDLDRLRPRHQRIVEQVCVLGDENEQLKARVARLEDALRALVDKRRAGGCWTAHMQEHVEHALGKA